MVKNQYDKDVIALMIQGIGQLFISTSLDYLPKVRYKLQLKLRKYKYELDLRNASRSKAYHRHLTFTFYLVISGSVGYVVVCITLHAHYVCVF